jgi:hypothetical protein
MPLTCTLSVKASGWVGAKWVSDSPDKEEVRGSSPLRPTPIDRTNAVPHSGADHLALQLAPQFMGPTNARAPEAESPGLLLMVLTRTDAPLDAQWFKKFEISFSPDPPAEFR